MADGGDLHRSLPFVDEVEDPVFAPSRRSGRRKRWVQLAADPVRRSQQRTGDKLIRCRGYLLRQCLGEGVARRPAQHQSVGRAAVTSAMVVAIGQEGSRPAARIASVSSSALT